jgi:hypothetical protein
MSAPLQFFFKAAPHISRSARYEYSPRCLAYWSSLARRFSELMEVVRFKHEW